MSLTVLVTGGSGGFGRYAAEALADRGHRVFVGVRHAEARRIGELAALARFPNVSFLEFELGDGALVDAAFAQVMREAGGLDALVHAAGQALFGLEDRP